MVQGADLGAIYMNGRYYVSTLNRFASADTLVPDPANPQGYNRYSYVLNSPLNFRDPTGHFCTNVGGSQICSQDDDMSTIVPRPPQRNPNIHAGALSSPCGTCGSNSADGNLGAAYNVFVEVEKTLGRPLTYAEILAFIIQEEYATSSLTEKEFALANEATGRLFYYFCGSSGICRNRSLWKFFGYHSTWTSANPQSIVNFVTGEIPANVSGAVNNILSQPKLDIAQATEEQLKANWRSGLPTDENGLSYPVPFHYGNYSLFSRSAQVMLGNVQDPPPIGTANNALLVNRQDLAFVVMTQGQKNYWGSQ